MTSMRFPSGAKLMASQLDVYGPVHQVEVLTSMSPSGKILHINVDGVCLLRIAGISRGTFRAELRDEKGTLVYSEHS